MQADLVPSTGFIPGTATEIRFLAPKPVVAITAAERARIEAEIEERLALLDAADGDPDLEFDGDEFEDADGETADLAQWRLATSWAAAGSSDDDEDEEYAAMVTDPLPNWEDAA